MMRDLFIINRIGTHANDYAEKGPAISFDMSFPNQQARIFDVTNSTNAFRIFVLKKHLFCTVMFCEYTNHLKEKFQNAMHTCCWKYSCWFCYCFFVLFCLSLLYNVKFYMQ